MKKYFIPFMVVSLVIAFAASFILTSPSPLKPPNPNEADG